MLLALNTKIGWKLAGDGVGSTQIALPSGWKEICYYLVYSNDYYIIAYFTSNLFSSTAKNVSIGNYGTSYALAKISSSTAYTNNVTWGGSDKLTSSHTYIYYR